MHTFTSFTPAYPANLQCFVVNGIFPAVKTCATGLSYCSKFKNCAHEIFREYTSPGKKVWTELLKGAIVPNKILVKSAKAVPKDYFI